eukprot:8279683-Pyramimonas_sp.AAC.1
MLELEAALKTAPSPALPRRGPQGTTPRIDPVVHATRQVSCFLQEFGMADYPELAEFVGRYRAGQHAYESAVLAQ